MGATVHASAAETMSRGERVTSSKIHSREDVLIFVPDVCETCNQFLGSVTLTKFHKQGAGIYSMVLIQMKGLYPGSRVSFRF